MSVNDEAVLRRFEREVLDVFHESLPLWNCQRSKAVYGLMAAFDTMLIPMEMVLSGVSEEDVGARLKLKLWHEGFNQALRWLTAEGLIMPSPVADGELLDKGGEFLLYASSYVSIAMMHVTYSRGLASIETDEEARLVRFLHPDSNHSEPWFNFAEGAIGDKDRLREEERSIAMSKVESSLENVCLDLSDGILRFSDLQALLTNDLLRFAELAVYPETIVLDDETDLAGFSLGQFRRFWRVLLAWSMAASIIFRGLTEGGTPQESCIPTQILSRKDFTRAIGDISGLDYFTVAKITDRLSYSPGRKADIFLQPLLCSGDWVAWSPLVVQLCKEERNCLKVMARSPHMKNQAANIIGSRERLMLKELGRFLAKRAGYDFKLNQLIRYNDEEAEIDLIAYNRKFPTELLLVEGKAILAVDDVGEVLGSSGDLEDAQGQIRRATRILQATPIDWRARQFTFVDWEKVESLYSIVLTPDSYPSSQVDQSEIPFITLFGLKKNFRARDLRSPSAIWAACREKAWLARLISPNKGFETIKIGDVTYEIPIDGVEEPDN